MRLTKFLGRKCKVCMRILLLKSLFLGTNCPSFLPILCGFLFVSAVDLFYRGFVSAVDSFVYIPSFFLFFSFLPCSFYYLPRNPKNVGDFLEKVHRFLEKVHFFWGGYSLMSSV